MKLVFTKSNLNKAVGIVMKAVPTRTTMNVFLLMLLLMKSSSQVTIWNLALKL